MGFPSSSKELVLVPKNQNDSNGYYEVLGISPNATKKEIQKAYREIVRCIHPDGCNPDKEMFMMIQEVYEVLINEQTRAEYNSVQDGFRFINRSEAFEIKSKLSESELNKLIRQRNETKNFSYFATKENDELAQEWYKFLIPVYQAFNINTFVRIALVDEYPPLKKNSQKSGSMLIIPTTLKPNFFTAMDIVRRALTT